MEIPINCAFDELVDIALLVGHPGNPKKHPAEQIDLIAKIIAHQGWRSPIVVSNRSGRIVAGHGRFEAAKKMGLARVPVDRQDFGSDADELAHLLADNRLADLGVQDNDLMAAAMGDLANSDLKFEMSGWSEQDFEELKSRMEAVKKSATDAPAEPEKADELNKVWNVSRGDVWRIGKHILVCGDSTDDQTVRMAMDGQKPNLMITDPPYGVNYDPKWRSGEFGGSVAEGKVLNDDNANWQKALERFRGSVFYCWHSAIHASIVAKTINAAGFEIRSQIIWSKNRFAISRGHYHWQHEPCWYSVREGGTADWIGDRKQTTIWNIDIGINDSGHGTQKPLECMMRPMANHIGDVYEPFAGSGTTMVAAENLGRRCHAIELHPPYCAVILQRMKNAFDGIEIKRVSPTSKE